METQANTGRYSIVTLTLLGVVMLILSSAIGAILGPVFFPTTINTTPQNQQAYLSSVNTVVSTDSVRVLSGSVKAFSGNRMTVRSLSGEQDPSLAERIVIVNYDTKITKTLPKDSKTLQAEMKNSSNKTTGLVLPQEPFTREVASASDIAIGDIVTVTASENISMTKEFIASDVKFHTPIKTPTNK